MIIGEPIIFDLSSVQAVARNRTTVRPSASVGDEFDIFNPAFAGLDLSMLDYSDDEIDVIKTEKPKKKKKKKKKNSDTPGDIIPINELKSEKESKKDIERRKREEQERKKAEKLRAEKEAAKKQAEIDIIQLTARKEYLIRTLGRLNPGKKKDSIKIVNINIELKQIENAIIALRKEHNLPEADIERGSRFSRFCHSAKRTIESGFSKIRRFFKRNKELIIGVASITVPMVASLIASSILKSTGSI